MRPSRGCAGRCGLALFGPQAPCGSQCFGELDAVCVHHDVEQVLPRRLRFPEALEHPVDHGRHAGFGATSPTTTSSGGRHGARDAEVYRREQREFAAGDRVTWTKNLPAIGVANGQTATVTAIDAAKGSFTVQRNGRQTTLEASSAEARHLEHGYAQTAQKLQGQTADRALIHAEHWRLNLTNQRSFYVLLSRAKEGVTIATSDRAGLIEAIRERSGEQQAALDRLEVSQAPEIARTAMQEVTQERERERQQQHEQQQQRERALQQQRERTDDDTRKPKPGGRGADLGQERDGPTISRQPERDYDDDMGY